MRNRWLAGSFLAAAAAVVALAACGSSSTSTPASTGGGTTAPAAGSTSSSSATGIKTATINGSTVLETASGMTIYWFAIDTPTKSNCNGTCVQYWPPVIGTPTLAPGVTLSGQLGTIKRSDGQLQATYDGHPLYTYAADSPGKMTGNGINTSGGLWWAMTPTGAKISTTSSGSGGSGGGGYGY